MSLKTPHSAEADNVVDRVLFLPLLDEVADLLLEGPHLEGLVDGQVELGRVERLDQVLESPELDGLDRRLHVVEGGHDQNDGPAVALPDAPQDLQAVDVGQPDIEEHQVGRGFAEGPDPALARLGDDDIKAFLGQLGGQGLADERVVLDDQDGSHEASSAGMRITKAHPRPRFLPTLMVPLCCSMILRALARPSPKPEGLVV
jgi:hypothetical protein